MRPPGTWWLTGLPAAGKTTLAGELAAALRRTGHGAGIVDGDQLRRDASRPLGFSREDRATQAMRACAAALELVASGEHAVVALVSPYASDRALARGAHAELGIAFLEIWVATPLAVCIERDPKGLYAAARSGRLTGLTGVDDPYEAPPDPDATVHAGVTAAAAADALLARFLRA